ncbi:hypothetical protein ACFWMR_00245 [Amycolatopsis thailandensis]|uniref:hypothetical protein n=1 Tax=Amycolatopsis thailandensis TaxID=589330 RepID=UPI00364CA867
MTIDPPREILRARNDGTTVPRDDEQHVAVPGPNPPVGEREETGAERRALFQLAGQILGSWPATIRLLAILTVIAGVMWLLNATVDLGLVRLGKP